MSTKPLLLNICSDLCAFCFRCDLHCGSSRRWMCSCVATSTAFCSTLWRTTRSCWRWRLCRGGSSDAPAPEPIKVPPPGRQPRSPTRPQAQTEEQRKAEEKNSQTFGAYWVATSACVPRSWVGISTWETATQSEQFFLNILYQSASDVRVLSSGCSLSANNWIFVV